MKGPDDLTTYHYVAIPSITFSHFREIKVQLVKNPMIDQRYLEAIDNLTPVVEPRETAFITLHLKKEKIGVVQLVNKVDGTFDDIEKSRIERLVPTLSQFVWLARRGCVLEAKLNDTE